MKIEKRRKSKEKRKKEGGKISVKEKLMRKRG